MRFALLFTVLALTMGSLANAQIDPSSAMLLNPNRTDVRESGIDTGRYTVKPKSEHKPRVHAEAHASPSPTPAPQTDSQSAQKPPTEAQQTLLTPSQAPTPTPAPSPVAAHVQQPAVEPVAQPTGPQSPTFSAQPDPNEFYGPQQPKPQVDERRTTMLELSFAPGYIYNDSKSTFAPRNYSVNAPTAQIDASVWTSQTFGVHTGFTSTINANVPDSLNNTLNVNVSEQWFVAGVKARTFFGDDRKAPTLTFGLDYSEFEFRTPSDTILRNKLTTTGLLLTLDAEVPTGHHTAYQIGGEFGPALSHRETSNLIDFRSGQSPKTTTVGIHIGARYRFDHTNELFWKISYGVEKNLFEGYTTVGDPITGLPQSNVAVTNSFSMFQLGYTWGN